jgi:DNA-binding transcriptional LysR family regulator
LSESERFEIVLAVNPVHVRTLQEIVRHQSFSRAAQALHLSQPAVSHHIRHLEQTLGQPLLERVGKRAFPTGAGEVVLAHAARAFAELEAARQSLQERRGVVAGRLRVGTGATASTYLLPPLLGRLRARHPDLELVVVTGNAAGMAAAVTAADLDVAVVTLPVRGRALLVTPLMLDPLVAIAPARAPWRRRRPLAAAELARQPLILYEHGGTIRRVIDDWFRRSGAAPRVVMDLGNGEAIKKLVAAGLGLSVVPAMSVRAEVRDAELAALPLSPPLGRRLGIVRRRDRVPSPALRVFLDGLGDLAQAVTRRPLSASRRARARRPPA